MELNGVRKRYDVVFASRLYVHRSSSEKRSEGGRQDMTCKTQKLSLVTAALVLVLGFASTTSAQVFTGRIDVTIVHATGGRLPVVNVDLTGRINQTQVTDAQGQAHFLSLTPGTYTV